jgi:hypothetical protein
VVINPITSVPDPSRFAIGRQHPNSTKCLGTLTKDVIEKKFGKEKFQQHMTKLRGAFALSNFDKENGVNVNEEVPDYFRTAAKPPRPQTIVQKYRERAMKTKYDGCSFDVMMGKGGV